jgi:hypothetical protein
MLLTEDEVLTLLQGIEHILDARSDDDATRGRIAIARALKDKLLACERVRVE